MSTKKPLKSWSYPFKTADAAAKNGSATWYNALAKASDGFYPVGVNGLWHGGIHFDASTGGSLKQDEGLCCIADGEVVAYRIDSAYPDINYTQGKARYSTGFTLVRHRLELPPPPKNKAPPKPVPAVDSSLDGAPDQPPRPAPEQLTFYSLYMHLLDWAGYEADKNKPRPAYWGGEATWKVSNKSHNKNKFTPGKTGINLRDASNTVTGLALTGAVLKLGAENPQKKRVFLFNRRRLGNNQTRQPDRRLRL